MKLTTEQITLILDMDFKQLYNYYTALINTYEELKEIESQIKHGIKIKFPIHYYLKKYYSERPKNKTVSIQGYGTYNINDFHEEIQTRQAIIIEAFLELQPEELFEKR